MTDFSSKLIFSLIKLQNFILTEESDIPFAGEGKHKAQCGESLFPNICNLLQLLFFGWNGQDTLLWQAWIFSYSIIW